MTVDGRTTGSIGRGVLALIGVQRGDASAQAERLLERVLGYRIFEDDTGRMNLSLGDIGGGLLLVSQFTLAADAHKGFRRLKRHVLGKLLGKDWAYMGKCSVFSGLTVVLWERMGDCC